MARCVNAHDGDDSESKVKQEPEREAYAFEWCGCRSVGVEDFVGHCAAAVHA